MAFSLVPLRRTVPAGVAAYVAGYLLTWVAAGGRLDRALSTTIDLPVTDPQPLASAFSSQPPTWKVVGWVFHGAHHADLLVVPENRAGVHPVDIVARLGDGYAALYAIPPLVLLASAYLVVAYSETPGPTGERWAGVSITLGYALACFAGGLLFTFGRPPTGPDLLTTVFLGGFIYPVVFGGLGGSLAGRVG